MAAAVITQATDWTSKAACRHPDVDPDWFHSAGNRSETQRREKRAKLVCKTCPVAAECLFDNLDVEYGTYGGHTDAERARIRGDSPDKLVS